MAMSSLSVASAVTPAVDADAAGGGSCVVGGAQAPLDRADAVALAERVKAVADPARLQILAMLGASDSGHLCVCDFPAVLGLSQPTVSHHLRVLAEAGLVVREQRGVWAHYGIAAEALTELVGALAAVAATSAASRVVS